MSDEETLGFHNAYTEITIHLKSGNGGKGSVSFLREKFKARGIADGGDGGKGGDIIFYATEKLNSLQSYIYERNFVAESGSAGSAKKKTGRHGADLRLPIPLHTKILNKDKDLLAFLDKDMQEYRILRGGRGGKGNAFFSSSRLRSPRFSQQGEPGAQLSVILNPVLKCDVIIAHGTPQNEALLITHITNARERKKSEGYQAFLPSFGTLQTPFENYTIIELPYQSHSMYELDTKCVVLLLDADKDISTQIAKFSHLADMIKTKQKNEIQTEVLVLMKNCYDEDLPNPQAIQAQLGMPSIRLVAFDIQNYSHLDVLRTWLLARLQKDA